MLPEITEELKPCPFCGGRAISGTTLDNAGYAMCADDNCWGMVGYLPTEAEAIAAWNRRGLEASLVEAPKVKGLEWASEPPYLVARAFRGFYSIECIEGFDICELRGTFMRCDFPSIEGAKAAAQSNYERHVLSALEPSQQEEAPEGIESRLDRAEAALHKIAQWSDAYPLAVFPEPDFVKVRELLAAGGITIDAVSASNMRHVIVQVGSIAKAALPASPPEPEQNGNGGGK